MNDYKDFEPEEEKEEGVLHYFCKLTFGQFFTLMVLEIITLAFVFYLGARYGNQYLKIDEIGDARKASVSIVSGTPREIASPERKADKPITEKDKLKLLARGAIDAGNVDLKEKVAEILARQHSPSAPPMGEPTADRDYQYMAEEVGNAAAEPSQENYQGRPVVMNQASTTETGGIIKIKSGNSKFAVQVGSYPDVKEASYRVEEWKAKGYPAYMIIADLGDKGQWYRVRIGAFVEKGEAANYLNGLNIKEGISDAFVVKNEQ